jgi:peptidoglycan/xylan/chitin deacetylase (PgdA/CDA1 family)
MVTMAVLMYHSVSAVDTGPHRDLAVPPELLHEQLTALTTAGYRLVGLTEAVERPCPGAVPTVAITFDDGYANFRHALPILADLGASATLYAAVGHLGAAGADWLGPDADVFGRFLTWSELREVAAAGVEIGNHSLIHHPLDVLPPEELEREVTRSRELLATELGTPVRSFAYPHGYHCRRVRAAVLRAGHDNACEVGRRLHRPGDDPYAIPRLQPTPDHRGADLVDLVRTGGPRLVPTAKRLAQPVWRQTRRIANRFGRTLT